MKKIFFISAIYILVSNSVFPQVGGIKSGSNNNSSTPKIGSESKGGVGCLADACAFGCSSGCYSFILQDIIMGCVKYHEEILDKRHDIPEVFSLELMPQFGYATPSSSLLIPRIRGNWGLFSTDFRYSNMTDFGTPGKIDFYSTIDWQILELNVVVTKPIIVRLGTGMMYEYYSSRSFIEHFIGIDANLNKQKDVINAEFRIAKDYYTGETPRMEGNLRFNHRILQANHIDAYAMAGAILQQYYSSTNVWTMQTGFEFNIH
jgi:hypothetical protein